MLAPSSRPSGFGFSGTSDVSEILRTRMPLLSASPCAAVSLAKLMMACAFTGYTYEHLVHMSTL